MEEQEDDRIYEVVLNHEEQSSPLPADRALPAGWQAVGKSGHKQEYLDYIKEL